MFQNVAHVELVTTSEPVGLSLFACIIGRGLNGEPTSLLLKHMPGQEKTIISMTPADGGGLVPNAEWLLRRTETLVSPNGGLSVSSILAAPWVVQRVLSTGDVGHGYIHLLTTLNL